MEELRLFLSQLKDALISEEPRPCKKIMEELLQRKWPGDYDAILTEANRLIRNYKLTEALELIEKSET